MYNKIMKMKSVIVNSGDWKKTVEIDSDIFDDIYVEACTQVVEEMAKNKKIRVAPVMICWDGETIITYNTYKILINASLYQSAEWFRKNFYNQTKIDLANEPTKSSSR